MRYLFDPSTPVSVPILGETRRFPVHRLYCLVRNHAAHALEMGVTQVEPPAVFVRPNDPHALRVVEPNASISLRFPSDTQKFQHEVELVVAIGKGGENIPLDQALDHVFGYAVGLDMTRFDLLEQLSHKGLPWCPSKSFEDSAVIGPITPIAQAPGIETAEIFLTVNGQDRQRSDLGRLIWDVRKTIEQLSRRWTLQPGDLLYMGTPDGVSPVWPGDVMDAGIQGLSGLHVRVDPH